MLYTLLVFFLALIVLVIVHEFGHFIVARACGVKVLRFSFGFGKVLASFKDKRGTEYSWSVFPLGGYVKMLDETEEPVPKHERHLAFNNQSIWAKIAIVIAGPLFNFIFAFLMFWLALLIGIKSLAPIIDAVKPNSIAAVAGLKPNQEIVEFNGKVIASWRDFQYAMMPYIGSKDTIQLGLKFLNENKKIRVELPLNHWVMDAKKPDLLTSLGIKPFIPSIPPIVAEVQPDSPAAKAGFMIGDNFQSIDGKKVEDWLDVVLYVKSRANQPVSIDFLRAGKQQNIKLSIGTIENNNKKQGFLGLRAKTVKLPLHWLRVQKEPPLQAAGTALIQTYEVSAATFSLLGRLVTGKLSLNNISGPVGIAEGAGDSARSGLVYYLAFLALVSISLAVLNLLPIPLLDGGHLFFYLIELIRGRAVSEPVKTAGAYVGLVLLCSLMALALSNDVTRLMG